MNDYLQKIDTMDGTYRIVRFIFGKCELKTNNAVGKEGLKKRIHIISNILLELMQLDPAASFLRRDVCVCVCVCPG